ncbi:MAG: DUF3386 family protein [Planctomycetota bacterium]|nr:MAG: DUF3386 family protein [Planctomycetota bacterium]
MLRYAFGALLGLAVLGASAARAHFIWLDVRPAADGGSQAALYFSEAPEPGEPHLIGKAAATKVWLRGADGDVQEVKLAAPADESAALVAECPGKSPASLEGSWDYGVYQRGPGTGVMLQYYAKRLHGDWAAHESLARAKKLKLDLVPALSGDKLAVQVLLDGKPAGVDVVFVDPEGEQHQLETNDEGRAELDALPGRWAIRAGHVDPEKSGERDGKKYNQTWHYATLVLDVPPASASAEPELSAIDALKRARDGRAMWEDEFPGFAADLTVHYDDKELQGTVEIDADGGVTLKLPESPAADWAEEQLYSLVQHRMPDGEVSEGNVTYVDEDDSHPLGRKISLGDEDFSSAYRIKDDVIMEVNRFMGPMRFTISVMEIERNAENKYLPRSFTMNFFDSKTGELRHALGYWNSWQRVGQFDLPTKILEIDAHKGGSTTKQIMFNNLRLLADK